MNRNVFFQINTMALPLQRCPILDNRKVFLRKKEMNDEKQKYCQMYKYNPKFCALYNKNVKIKDS